MNSANINVHGERIKTKYKMNSANMNVHGYCSNHTYLQNFGLLDVDIFWTKIYKFDTFFYYMLSDVGISFLWYFVH